MSRTTDILVRLGFEPCGKTGQWLKGCNLTMSVHESELEYCESPTELLTLLGLKAWKAGRYLEADFKHLMKEDVEHERSATG